MKERLHRAGSLFGTFFKIGAFTFGGGYAMIPLIQREVVEKRRWMEQSDILDIVAIAESTPGPIAINTATFVGYRTGGLVGAGCATLGVVLPSFVIIFALSFVLRQFQALKAVQYAFWGIRAGVLALLVKALLSMYGQCPKGGFAWTLMALAFLLAAFSGIGVIYVLIGCAAAGLVRLYGNREHLEKGGKVQ